MSRNITLYNIKSKTPAISRGFLFFEASSGFEPLYEVLQTSA